MKLAAKLILLFVISMIVIVVGTTQFRYPLITVTAMGLLSIGVVMIAGVRWIATPLELLTEKMERVGQGDFASDLAIHSKDELGQLSNGIPVGPDRRI